jgi:hypothetical protein
MLVQLLPAPGWVMWKTPGPVSCTFNQLLWLPVDSCSSALKIFACCECNCCWFVVAASHRYATLLYPASCKLGRSYHDVKSLVVTAAGRAACKGHGALVTLIC